jgi:hypothetical protein
MFSLLLAIIYLAFISLGLPDALLGFRLADDVQGNSVCRFSYAGGISMIIAVGNHCVQLAK